MSSWFKPILIAASLITTAHSAIAGVIIGGTRVVYNAERKESSISVKNPETKHPYLMQNWLTNFNEADKSKPPFIVTPPLFRLDAGKENILRVIRTGGSLPDDRESMYWLNIKSIPASTKTDSNTLAVSVKTQIKMIYRPATLKGDANIAYKDITFIRQGTKVQVKNPTPFYISFYSVKVGVHEVKNSGTLAPMGSLNWDLPSGATGMVSWQAINDFGGITEAETRPL